jgi:hypothetical protein
MDGARLDSHRYYRSSSQFPHNFSLSYSDEPAIGFHQISEEPMLKLIYTETSLHLELLTSDLEEWIEHRLLFATSIGQKIFVSAEKATFLLPSFICEATALNLYLYREGVQSVSGSQCDLDRVEIELTGYWLATDLDSAEGIFATQLPDRVESYLWQLWNSANNHSVTTDRALG